MTSAENQQWQFGSFRLDGAQHLLFRDGKLMPLSRKATDILIVLVENHGQLVEKETLMRRVWPDSFVEESNLAVHISQLRKLLSENQGANPIETIPRRGYRFVGEIAHPPVATGFAPAPIEPALEISAPQKPAEPIPAGAFSIERLPRRRQWGIFAAVAVCLAVAALLGWRLAGYPRKKADRAAPSAADAAPPHMKDSVLLADIGNNTGDPVFDATLRRAMAVELEQSPYLRLLPDTRIQQSLRLMGLPGDQALTPEVARNLCQRNGGEAVIDGWIARLGPEYVLGVRALNCRTGDHIADLQTTASGKEQVLKALGDVTGQLRAKLGESLSTVQRFNTPIEDATTSSLEALRAYSDGMAAMIQKGESTAGVPFFQRAVRLDPDFAIAYAALGNAYSNISEVGLASANLRRAYELRQRVSERERLYIESHYYQIATGDLDKAASVYGAWAATYPEDEIPRTDLALIDSELGKIELSLENAKAALRIAPDVAQNYGNLTFNYILVDRLGDAHATIQQGLARGFDTSDLHLYMDNLAFLEHDQAGMEKQIAWAAGEPGIADLFLGFNADSLAFEGRLAQAREFTARATDAAKRADEKETAAGYQMAAAQREALFGNLAEAKRMAAVALNLAHDRDTRYGAAAALALAGDVNLANGIADRLNKDFPDDTIVQFLYLPAIRGAAALQEKDPARAIRALEPANPYEVGVSTLLFSAYLRGLAYLQIGDGGRAATEFDKIVAHPGIMLNSPLGPLARLQLARAYQIQGRQADATSAYQDFLTRWKDADPSIPVLIAAKAEYARQLQVAQH